ncbi:MAG: hypothetical protein JST92_18040 [Deltaproteobacteria bacterium]|nr:hypothetical protein [Deltaproteobacteria bacterium]
MTSLARVALAAVSLYCIALAARAAPPPHDARDLDPARLAGTRFYEQKVATQIREGTLKVWEWSDGAPTAFNFPKPGKIELEWGQDAETCSFMSMKGAARGVFALELTCPTGPRNATLTWTGAGKLKVEGLFADKKSDGDFERQDKAFAKIVGEVEAARSARDLPKFAGKWKAEGGALSVDAKKGAAQLDGSRWLARAVECRPEDSKEHVVCLDLAGGDEKQVMFVPDAGFKTLTEGSLETEDVTEGRQVNKKAGARVFTRVDKK